MSLKLDKLPVIHPGQILKHDFLEEMDISEYRLARDIRVPPRRINEIVHGKRGITVDTAMRLARYFGTSVQMWMNFQQTYEIARAQREIGPAIDKEVTRRAG